MRDTRQLIQPDAGGITFIALSHLSARMLLSEARVDSGVMPLIVIKLDIILVDSERYIETGKMADREAYERFCKGLEEAWR